MTQYPPKLLNIDAFEFINSLSVNDFQLVVTDPPYEFSKNFNKGGGVYKSIKNASKVLNETAENVGKVFDPLPLLNALKPKMSLFNGYFWTNKNLIHVYTSWAHENGFIYDIIPYCKRTAMASQNNGYLKDREFCVFIREHGAYWNARNGYKNYMGYFVSAPLEFKKTRHPNEKPLQLHMSFIKNSCPPDGCVLDPFFGSGTTLLASYITGRKSIGSDDWEDAYMQANERIRNYETLKLNKK